MIEPDQIVEINDPGSKFHGQRGVVDVIYYGRGEYDLMIVKLESGKTVRLSSKWVVVCNEDNKSIGLFTTPTTLTTDTTVTTLPH